MSELFDLLASVQKSMAELAQTCAALESENLKLKNENCKLVDRFRRHLQQQTFMALLQPGHGAEDISELCSRLSLDTEDKKFVLLELSNDLVLSCEDRVPGVPFDDEEKTGLIDKIRIQLRQAAECIVIPYGDRFLCLLVFPVMVPECEIFTLISRQLQTLNETLDGFTLFAAISRVVSETANLSVAFTEVKQLTDYKTIMEDNAPDILFASEQALHGTTTSTEAPVSEEQRQFVFLIRIGDFCDAIPVAQALCRKRLLENTTAETLPLTMASLKDNFIHFLGNACMDLHLHPIYERLGSAQRIAEAATVQKLMEELEQILQQLQVGFSALSPVQSLPQRMKSYIDENFSNPDINVNAVANFFEISPAYATKLFRGAYNIGLLDYIHQRRMFTAKELLGSGRSIAEIAELSGYGTSSNMIRVFKRIEGVTPGQIAKASHGRVVPPY